MQKRYFVLYKPYRMMSQFSREGDKATLADIGPLPKDVYPVGRLDYDSEGLLILTNDKTLNNRLLDPKFGHHRTYLAQVEGAPQSADVEKLNSGILIKVNGKNYQTRPAKARILEHEPNLPERVPPIRYRKSVPDTWLELTLHEGKNRQVRKMTAGIGFPTLRLVRIAIGQLNADGMTSGQVVEWQEKELYERLFD